MNSVRKQIGPVLRYSLLVIFFFLLNIIFLPSSIFAQTPNLVGIVLNPTSLDPMKINDTVTVGVDIYPGNTYKVTGIEVKINYSSQTLELFNTIPGDYLSLPTALQCPNCQPKIENGTYTATFVSGTGANPKTTIGRLLQLQFKAIGNGDGRVTVDTTATNISGYDAQDNPVDTNLLGIVNNASYTISAATPTVTVPATATATPPVNSSQSGLSFQPTTGTYNIGDTFYVDVNLNTRNTPVYGAKIVGTYNPEFIQPVNNSVTPLNNSNWLSWTPPVINEFNRNQFILDYGNNQTAFNGTAPLARMIFKTIKAGQAQMDFTFFQQYDNTTPEVAAVYGKRDGVTTSNVLTDVNQAIYVISDQNSCSQEGGPCGVGVAGPSHPLGTCCNGLTCVESNMPDAGGTCRNGPISCYQLPACVNDNPPCDINVPAGAVICPTTAPPPTCASHPFGDANCDGIINDRDYRIWEYEMQFPKLPNKRADFNGDGREDMVDFEILRRNSQGTDVCTNSDNTASMTYTQAKSIAENSNCTSEGIIRDEGREYCNSNTGTWWLPFSSLSNSRPGCSPACVVDIVNKTAEINWRCTGLITPTPSQCCSQNQLDNGFQCVINCGPPVAGVNDPPPGYSCLSPAEVTSREQFGCPLMSNSSDNQANPSPTSGSNSDKETESDIEKTEDVINQDGDNVSQGTNEIWIGTGGSTDRSYAGFHFKNVKIPKGAKIINAKLEFQNAKKQWISLNMEIAAEDDADAKPFTRDNPPGKRKLGSNRTKHLSNEEWKANSRVSLNDMKPVIQAIVDKPDWQEGNALNIILKGKGTSWGRKYVTNSDNQDLSPKLIIKYQ